MYNVKTIAEWFLAYNDKRREFDDEDTDMISNLKLQKLLYYAQGAFLAVKNTPLFKEKILAWKHGPVVEEIYQEYKVNGANGIVPDEDYNIEVSEEDLELLVEVYDTFGKYSAWGLRQLSHQETPWIETEQGDVIPLEKIKDYFEKHYVS